MKSRKMYLLTVILYVGLFNSATAYNSYRLPNVLQPESYNLKIITHFNEGKKDDNFYFDGSVEIQFKVLTSTKNITLHAKDLKINETKTELILLWDERKTCIDYTEVIPDFDYYVLHLCNRIKKGEKYVLNLFYRGFLSTNGAGYYTDSYYDEKQNKYRWFSVTQFKPAMARTAFPCFDEPEYKAKFSIMLGHHSSYYALSNTQLKTVRKLSSYSDWSWSIFAESELMSTYHVAFSVNDFKSVKSDLSQHSKVIFRTWKYANVTKLCEYETDLGPKILTYFENTFDIDFPLSKIDQVIVPNKTQASTANLGLITYQESIIEYNKKLSTLQQQQDVIYNVAHALAQQWFGNLVTIKWWSQNWINEAFAIYMAIIAGDNVISESYLQQTFLRDLSNVLHADAFPTSQPLVQDIEEISGIEHKFNIITYKKGSTILRMMNSVLGNDIFFRGIRSYLKRFKYSSVDHDYFWKFFKSVNSDINTIIDSWTLQSGYPLLNVVRNYEQKTVTITQERYLTNQNHSRDEFSNCWWVPLTFTTKKDTNFNNTSPKYWLKCDSENNRIKKTIQLNIGEDDWIIFNLQYTGLYRVNYDERNWNILTKTLRDDFEKIYYKNRAQLIEDAFALAWSGDISYDIPLNLLEYLKKEKHRSPLVVATAHLHRLIAIVKSHSHYIYFKKHWRDIIEPIYNYYNGLKVDSSQKYKTFPYHDIKAKISYLACILEVDDCVDRAKSYMSKWISLSDPDAANPIPINLRKIVYETAVVHGGGLVWKFLSKRYRLETNETETLLLLKALACTREVSYLQLYLNWLFNQKNPLKNAFKIKIFKAIVSNDVGLFVANDYFTRNFKTLCKMFNSEIISLFTVLVDGMNKLEDYDKIKLFISQNKSKFLPYRDQVDETLELLQMRAEWRRRNVEILTVYVNDRVKN